MNGFLAEVHHMGQQCPKAAGFVKLLIIAIFSPNSHAALSQLSGNTLSVPLGPGKPLHDGAFIMSDKSSYLKQITHSINPSIIGLYD